MIARPLIIIGLVASIGPGCRSNSPSSKAPARVIEAENSVYTSEVDVKGKARAVKLVQGSLHRVDGYELGVMWVSEADEEVDAAHFRVAIIHTESGQERTETLEMGEVLTLGERAYRVSAVQPSGGAGGRGVVELAPVDP